MNKKIKLFIFLVIFTFVNIAVAEKKSIEVSTVADKSVYSIGDSVTVALKVSIPDEFHLYSNPMGPGIGKELDFSIGSTGAIKWTKALQLQPKKYNPIAGDWVWAWEKSTVIFAKGILTKESAEFTDTFYLSGLMCSESCIPQNSENRVLFKTGVSVPNKSFTEDKELSKALENCIDLIFTVNGKTIGSNTESNAENLNETVSSLQNEKTEADYSWDYTPRENEVQFNIFLAIILAFIAGVILNVMPCVLPVLGIKILSFSKGKGQNKKKRIMSSIWFSIGMISVFLLLATLASVAGMSWGQQFQSPMFIIVLVSLMFIFGLGMFDIFIILVPTKIGELEHETKSGIFGDIARGMFATLLATPCSGPFLGATLAWTLTQPPVVIYTIFTSLGLGMASPYIILSASDRLLKIIPKPGTWMEDFKHLMGFFLFGFAVYLMIGLPTDKILPLVGFLVSIAFSLMLYKRFAPFGSSLKRKATVALIALAISAYGWHLTFGVLYGFISQEAANKAEANSELKWEKFSAKKLIEANKKGQSVIVDFTANWCMNCQFNKIHVYHSEEVNKLIKEKNILAMKGDITVSNPPVESLLHHLGSRSVPFFAIFPGDDPMHPIVMRDIVKKDKVIATLKKLKKFE